MIWKLVQARSERPWRQRERKRAAGHRGNTDKENKLVRVARELN